MPSVNFKSAICRTSAISGFPTSRRYARRSASRRICAIRVSSIIGRRAAGRICASPSAPTISPASEVTMMNLLAELKRRQMFRVAAAYAVVAWVLLQVVNNVAPALRLPDWAATLVLVLLVIGFPVALLFCWIQQLAPGGESSKTTTSKLDWVLIVALILVIGLVSYQQLTPNSAAPVAQEAGVVAARSASLAPAGVSVAVLPFANVSADPEQEFFSDGITDEISGALAKIPDLRVVARTSAFQYKTRNTDIRSIGQALNATHLIEGSVRRA